MIVVVGSFRLPVAHLAAARAAMARVMIATRAEVGCLAYAYAEDLLEPGLIRVNEAWTTREALALHFEQPHMIEWKRERADFGLTERVMTAYEISGEEAL
ncbi:MAG: antibiotic biosynthesis monooxygenase [Novosphingobium sp.]|nr:MAG: antibiotic biosynthesis monooxygenase [Novosphingobium sp.]